MYPLASSPLFSSFADKIDVHPAANFSAGGSTTGFDTDNPYSTEQNVFARVGEPVNNGDWDWRPPDEVLDWGPPSEVFQYHINDELLCFNHGLCNDVKQCALCSIKFSEHRKVPEKITKPPPTKSNPTNDTLRRTVCISVTDIDATDSSSSDKEDEVLCSRRVKQYVHGINIGTSNNVDCSSSANDREIDEVWDVGPPIEFSDDDVDCLSSANERNCNDSNKRKALDKEEAEAEAEEKGYISSSLKKPCVAPGIQLKYDEAGHKRSLKLMNVPGLTRENVARRLQTRERELGHEQGPVEIITAPTNEGDATQCSTHVAVEEHVSLTQTQNSGRELEHEGGSFEIITPPTEEDNATHSSTHVIVEDRVSLTQAQKRAKTKSPKRAKTKSPKRQVKGESLSMTRGDLEQYFGQPLPEVVKILGVSRSTIKRICRECGIKRWPFHERNKSNHSLFEAKNSTAPLPEEVEDSPTVLDRNPACLGVPLQENVCSIGQASVQDTMIQNATTFIVKALYGKDSILKFKMQSTSKLVALEEEVVKRLKLKVGSFIIKYQDEEDWVSLLCDEDLQLCMEELSSHDKSIISPRKEKITIKMLIQLKTE